MSPDEEKEEEEKEARRWRMDHGCLVEVVSLRDGGRWLAGCTSELQGSLRFSSSAARLQHLVTAPFFLFSSNMSRALCALRASPCIACMHAIVVLVFKSAI